MKTYEVNFEIEADADQIWNVMSDVERWSEWTASITSVTALSTSPMQVGSRYRVVQPKLPPVIWEVTEFEPGKFFIWEARSLGTLSVGEHRIIAPPENGKVRLKLAIRQSGWLFALIGGLFASLTKNYVDTEARGLKQRCENSET